MRAVTNVQVTARLHERNAVVYPVRMTLVCNGLPSGATDVELTELGTTVTEINPSGNHPFKSCAALYRVCIRNVMELEDMFVIGMIELWDCNCAILSPPIPFIFYNGKEWIDAPLGMVHFRRMVQDWHETERMQFSLLFEKALPN